MVGNGLPSACVSQRTSKGPGVPMRPGVSMSLSDIAVFLFTTTLAVTRAETVNDVGGDAGRTKGDYPWVARHPLTICCVEQTLGEVFCC